MSAHRSSREKLSHRPTRARRLTRDQVREIRLSTLGPVEVGKAFGLHPKSIGNIRNGHNYGPLRPDEAAAHRRRCGPPELKPPPSRETLLIGAKFPILGRPDLNERLDGVRLLDAENECRVCGWMSHDPIPHPCERPVLVVIPGVAALTFDFESEAA